LEDYISHITDPEDGYKSPKAKAFEIATMSVLGLAVISVATLYIIKRRK